MVANRSHVSAEEYLAGQRRNGAGDTLTLSSVALSCPMGLLYEDVRLEDMTDAEPAPDTP